MPPRVSRRAPKSSVKGQSPISSQTSSQPTQPAPSAKNLFFASAAEKAAIQAAAVEAEAQARRDALAAAAQAKQRQFAAEQAAELADRRRLIAAQSSSKKEINPFLRPSAAIAKASAAAKAEESDNEFIDSRRRKADGNQLDFNTQTTNTINRRHMWMPPKGMQHCNAHVTPRNQAIVKSDVITPAIAMNRRSVPGVKPECIDASSMSRISFLVNTDCQSVLLPPPVRNGSAISSRSISSTSAADSAVSTLYDTSGRLYQADLDKFIASSAVTHCLERLNAECPSQTIIALRSLLMQLLQRRLAAHRAQQIRDDAQMQRHRNSIVHVDDSDDDADKDCRADNAPSSSHSLPSDTDGLLLDSMWTWMYRPLRCDDVLGNSSQVTRLRQWMSAWTAHANDAEDQKSTTVPLANAAEATLNAADVRSPADSCRQRVKTHTDLLDSSDEEQQHDSDSDFEIESRSERKQRANKRRRNRFDHSASDSCDHDQSQQLQQLFPNTILLLGAHACGKKAAVYACAAQHHCHVIEINAATRRTQKDVVAAVGEATQSHRLTLAQSKSAMSSFFAPAAARVTNTKQAAELVSSSEVEVLERAPSTAATVAAPAKSSKRKAPAQAVISPHSSNKKQKKSSTASKSTLVITSKGKRGKRGKGRQRKDTSSEAQFELSDESCSNFSVQSDSDGSSVDMSTSESTNAATTAKGRRKQSSKPSSRQVDPIQEAEEDSNRGDTKRRSTRTRGRQSQNVSPAAAKPATKSIANFFAPNSSTKLSKSTSNASAASGRKQSTLFGLKPGNQVSPARAYRPSPLNGSKDSTPGTAQRSAAALFAPANATQPTANRSSAASARQTIVLFSEIDQVFADDLNFYRALKSLINTAKRPLVMTCSDVPLSMLSADNIVEGVLQVSFDSPCDGLLSQRSADQVSAHETETHHRVLCFMYLICLVESGFSDTSNWFSLSAITQLLVANRGDIRSTLLTLQLHSQRRSLAYVVKSAASISSPNQQQTCPTYSLVGHSIGLPQIMTTQLKSLLEPALPLIRSNLADEIASVEAALLHTDAQIVQINWLQSVQHVMHSRLSQQLLLRADPLPVPCDELYADTALPSHFEWRAPQPTDVLSPSAAASRAVECIDIVSPSTVKAEHAQQPHSSATTSASSKQSESTVPSAAQCEVVSIESESDETIVAISASRLRKQKKQQKHQRQRRMRLQTDSEDDDFESTKQEAKSQPAKATSAFEQAVMDLTDDGDDRDADMSDNTQSDAGSSNALDAIKLHAEQLKIAAKPSVDQLRAAAERIAIDAERQRLVAAELIKRQQQAVERKLSLQQQTSIAFVTAMADCADTLSLSDCILQYHEHPQTLHQSVRQLSHYRAPYAPCSARLTAGFSVACSSCFDQSSQIDWSMTGSSDICRLRQQVDTCCDGDPIDVACDSQFMQEQQQQITASMQTLSIHCMHEQMAQLSQQLNQSSSSTACNSEIIDAMSMHKPLAPQATLNFNLQLYRNENCDTMVERSDRALLSRAAHTALKCRSHGAHSIAWQMDYVSALHDMAAEQTKLDIARAEQAALDECIADAAAAPKRSMRASTRMSSAKQLFNRCKQVKHDYLMQAFAGDDTASDQLKQAMNRSRFSPIVQA